MAAEKKGERLRGVPGSYSFPFLMELQVNLFHTWQDDILTQLCSALLTMSENWKLGITWMNLKMANAGVLCSA